MKSEEIFKQKDNGSYLYIPHDSQIGDCFLIKTGKVRFGEESPSNSPNIDDNIIVIAVTLKRNIKTDLKIINQLHETMEGDLNIFKILSKSRPGICFNSNDYVYAERGWEIEKL